LYVHQIQFALCKCQKNTYMLKFKLIFSFIKKFFHLFFEPLFKAGS